MDDDFDVEDDPEYQGIVASHSLILTFTERFTDLLAQPEFASTDVRHALTLWRQAMRTCISGSIGAVQNSFPEDEELRGMMMGNVSMNILSAMEAALGRLDA